MSEFAAITSLTRVLTIFSPLEGRRIRPWSLFVSSFYGITEYSSDVMNPSPDGPPLVELHGPTMRGLTHDHALGMYPRFHAYRSFTEMDVDLTHDTSEGDA